MGQFKAETAVRQKDGTLRRGPADDVHNVYVERNAKAKKTGRKKQPRKVREYKTGGGVVRIRKNQMAIMTGQENLDEWTIDELVEGKKKGKGRPPNLIPIEVHQELARRVLNEAQHQFVAELGYTIQKHFAIVKGIEMERRKIPGTRKFEEVAVNVTPTQLRAVLAIEERVLGMPREQVDVNIAIEKPYEKLLASAIVPNKEALEEYEKQKEEEHGEIIDAELVDEEESED